MIGPRAFIVPIAAVVAAAVGASCNRAAPAPAAQSPAGQAQQVVQPAAPGQPSTVLPAGTAPSFPKDAHTEADTRFMQGMIHHHEQALEMTLLLRTRTERDDMKLLAERIEVSQADEIRMMRAWLTERGEALPMDHTGHPGMAMAPMTMMPGMLTPEQMAALAAAQGAEFDRLFLTGMIQHHEGALVMVEDLFKSPGAGEEPNIFDFATHVDADQRMDISRMRGILRVSGKLKDKK